MAMLCQAYMVGKRQASLKFKVFAEGEPSAHSELCRTGFFLQACA